ncbi:cysteine desulfurase family protein [Flavivirga abyssicola]|uniref:cysteine desulfurase family protein n=1 Tax=Flavivirga abyssicola TaxID=3063533 RepID=UPI0026DFF85E|nr:cysteine desulfurase family protein [Flavivirga sp. MEBiC07777]WVK12527.1 cysteine desulfurase family protein [Flavivirga sp. MEBiC07777]
MKNVYFDNAATTQMRDEVITAITEVMKKNYGNASSSHSFGRSSKSLIEQSRKTIAQYLNVSAGEIVFTAGGTEADNLVLRSAVRDLGVNHVITSKIEHHAVLHTIEQLEKEYNILVSYVDITANGDVDYKHLETLIQTENKTLVSLMHINNEIGNILDIEHVANLCKANDALFHTDAVQSIGHYKMDLQALQIDFLAASAHKFHGPKGVGFTFIRKNSGLKPLIFGGEQERGLRAGTESVHNIIGMEVALKSAYANMNIETDSIKTLKRYFIDKIMKDIPKVTFNGQSDDLEKSTYTLINICLPVPPKKAAMLLFQLDLKGIACSKGSACQSGSSQNSHVLTEILNDIDLQKPSIRFSFSVYNTKEEVDYVIDVLKAFIE